MALDGRLLAQVRERLEQIRHDNEQELARRQAEV